MASQNEIDQVIDFLSLNVEFFAIYENWKDRQESGKLNAWLAQKNISLMNDLIKGPLATEDGDNKKLLAFFDAIFDKRAVKKSLYGGDEHRIRKFLENFENGDVVDFLKKYLNDPSIEEWYKTEGSKYQLARNEREVLQGQQPLIEKPDVNDLTDNEITREEEVIE